MATQLSTDAVQPGATKQTRSGARRGSAKRADEIAIGTLMRTEVYRVDVDASANDAARLMWEKDIGSVPVVDEGGRLNGIVTDRDIAMAAYLRGVRLWDIPIRSLMTTEVVSAHADDSMRDVATLMSRRQVRRVPIVDDGGLLVGIVALNDLALAATGSKGDGIITAEELADALRAICAPRSSTAGEQPRTN